MTTRQVQTQGNFLGGQWDTASQGRFDHPWWKTALDLSTNGLPLENGVWAKRSGTQWLGPTYKRLTGWVRPFEADTNHRYAVVFTTDGNTGWAHFWHQDSPLTDTSSLVDASSSSSGVVSVTTHTATGWSVGDQVIATGLSALGQPYLNRWMTVTAIAGTAVTLKDDLGNAFVFADPPSGAMIGATLYRIVRCVTGFTANLDMTQIVNIGSSLEALLLCFGQVPQLLSLVNGAPDTITVTAASFVDGPYLDVQGGDTPETGTVSAYSGSITFTPASSSFVAGDVGRLIRLFSQPAAWASGTTYNVGDLVTYNSAWWTCVYGGVSAVQPGTFYTSGTTQILVWAPAPLAGQWAWGKITAQAGASCTVSLTTNLLSANGTTITKWRLGAFTGGTNPTYPMTGILDGGRIYLGGAREGRFDAGMADANNLLTFSPSDINGNVFDDHGISETLSSASLDHITWFSADRSGLMIGTVAEEYLLTGGGANDTITPSNFLIRRMSSYGCPLAKAQAGAGFSKVFIQTFDRIIYEYVSDAFVTAPTGRVLNEFSRELVAGAGGATELAYADLQVPTIWAVAGFGSLLSCTYRRASRFMSNPPDMAGWARHNIADNQRLAGSVCALSARVGWADTLYLTTSANGAGIANGIEKMRPVVV